MTILSLDQLLTTPTLKEEVIDIPELGGAVKVRAMTKAQQQQMRDDATLKYNTRTQKAGEIDNSLLELLMVAHSVVEPALDKSHVAQLRALPAGVIDRIIKSVLRINGMTEEAVAQADAAFQESSNTAL